MTGNQRVIKISLKNKDKKVLIVGAGGSGLMCGAMLSKYFDVEVFEKTKNTGGRAKGIMYAGARVDWGPHVLRYGEYGDIMKVFDIAGIEKPRCESLGVSIYHNGTLEKFASGTGSVLANKIALVRSKVLGIKDRFRFIKTLLKLIKTADENPRSLRGLPVPQWAREKGLSDDVVDLFTTLACATNTCTNGDDTSTLELGLHLARGLEYGKTITHPMGGFSRLHDGLEDKLIENGGELHKGTKVDKVFFNGNRAAGIRAGNRLHRGDYVIIGAPSSVMWDGLVDTSDITYLRKEDKTALKEYIAKCKAITPNSGLCLDMVIDTTHYKERALIIHPNSFMPSIMCMISNTDRSLAPSGKSYLTFLGLVDHEKLKEHKPAYQSLAWRLIEEVYPDISSYKHETRALCLDIIDGAETNVSQEQWARPSSFIPHIPNLFNPSDDKREGHSGGMEIAAGSSIAVYKHILGLEGKDGE